MNQQLSTTWHKFWQDDIFFRLVDIIFWSDDTYFGKFCIVDFRLSGPFPPSPPVA